MRGVLLLDLPADYNRQQSEPSVLHSCNRAARLLQHHLPKILPATPPLTPFHKAKQVFRRHKLDLLHYRSETLNTSNAAHQAAAHSMSCSKQVQDVVGHPALVITRNVEWGTVIFGFEQANKYTIYDQQGNVVALLAEELGSFGKEVGRQLLRTRRPFTATVFSPDGEPIPHPVALHKRKMKPHHASSACDCRFVHPSLASTLLC